MPFGLFNAASMYRRMLDLGMAHLPEDYWLSYLDDVLVYYMESQEHIEHLRKVVQAHTKAGIRIQPKKTKRFQSEVEYLGHKVSLDGEKDFKELKAEFTAGKIQDYV